MQNDEDTNSLRASVVGNAPDEEPAPPIPTTGNGSNDNGHEAGFDSVRMAKLLFSAEAAKHAALSNLAKSVKLEDLFVTQPWHRPYAETLLNTNASNLAELIDKAERAILDRYLELARNPSPTDELVDLGHAVDALGQLKKAYSAAA